MNIKLGAEWESFVNERVQSGRYPSAADVLQDGLRLLDEREKLRALRERELRDRLDQGADELDSGDYVELDEAGMRAYLEDVDRRGKERLANGAAQKPS